MSGLDLALSAFRSFGVAITSTEIVLQERDREADRLTIQASVTTALSEIRRDHPALSKLIEKGTRAGVALSQRLYVFRIEEAGREVLGEL